MDATVDQMQQMQNQEQIQQDQQIQQPTQQPELFQQTIFQFSGPKQQLAGTPPQHNANKWAKRPPSVNSPQQNHHNHQNFQNNYNATSPHQNHQNNSHHASSPNGNYSNNQQRKDNQKQAAWYVHSFLSFDISFLFPMVLILPFAPIFFFSCFLFSFSFSYLYFLILSFSHISLSTPSSL